MNGTSTYPENTFYRHCLTALVLFCSLLWNQAVNANDTYYIDKWIDHYGTKTQSLPDIHIGFFFIRLRGTGLSDSERIMTHEEFNLDRNSFQNLLRLFFELDNLPSQGDSVESFRPRHFAVSILLEMFNRNLEAAQRSGQNRQMLQQQFSQFYRTFTTRPLRSRLSREYESISTNDREITFENYFDPHSFVSVNEYTNANNGLMALMYATLAPFIFSQQRASGVRDPDFGDAWEMHNRFDYIQRVFIRKASLRRSSNIGRFPEGDSSDMSMFQNMDSLIRHVGERDLESKLLLLISLRSFAFYAYRTLVQSGSVETDFLPIIRQFMPMDISTVLVHQLIEGRLRAHGVRLREVELANAFQCGVHEANSRLPVFFWMHSAMAITRFREQESVNTQQLFNALLEGEPVFSVPPRIGQGRPETEEGGPASPQGTGPGNFDAVSDQLRRVLQIISEQTASGHSGQESQADIDWWSAYTQFSSSMGSIRTDPEPYENIRQPRLTGSNHYNQLAADIAEMVNQERLQEPEPRRNSGERRQRDTASSDNGLSLVFRYISTLDDQLDTNGRPVAGQLSPEAQGAYDFFRGYLSRYTFIRPTLPAPRRERNQPGSAAGPQPIQGNQVQNRESLASVSSHLRSESSVPRFGYGDACLFCTATMNSMAWLTGCGHCNFCFSCLQGWGEVSTNSQRHGSGPVRCPVCREINQEDQIKRYDPPGRGGSMK